MIPLKPVGEGSFLALPASGSPSPSLAYGSITPIITRSSPCVSFVFPLCVSVPVCTFLVHQSLDQGPPYCPHPNLIIGTDPVSGWHIHRDWELGLQHVFCVGRGAIQPVTPTLSRLARGMESLLLAASGPQLGYNSCTGGTWSWGEHLGVSRGQKRSTFCNANASSASSLRNIGD